MIGERKNSGRKTDGFLNCFIIIKKRCEHGTLRKMKKKMPVYVENTGKWAFRLLEMFWPVPSVYWRPFGKCSNSTGDLAFRVAETCWEMPK
jgi:hypothetical protein